MSARNIALSDQMKLWGQNFASRLIGFLVRSVVILTAVFAIAGLCFTFALGLVVWLALPLLVVTLPVVGLIVVFAA